MFFKPFDVLLARLDFFGVTVFVFADKSAVLLYFEQKGTKNTELTAFMNALLDKTG